MAVRYPGSRAGEGAASPPRAHSGCRGQAPADVSGSAACSRSGDLRVPCRLALARGATVPLASGGSPRGRPTPVCPRSCAPPMGHTGMFARGDDPPDPPVAPARLRRPAPDSPRSVPTGRNPTVPAPTRRAPLHQLGPVPPDARDTRTRQPAPVRPETSVTPPACTGTPRDIGHPASPDRYPRRRDTRTPWSWQATEPSRHGHRPANGPPESRDHGHPFRPPQRR